MTFQELERRIQNAKTLDFGVILDHCFKLYKKIWLQGFLMVIIMMVFGLGTAFLLVSIGLVPNPYDVGGYEGFDFFSFYAKSALNNLPQTLVLTPVMLGMLAGFYRICRQYDLTESQNDDLFYFFKGGHFRKVLFLGLIYSLIAALAQALFLIPYLYVIIPLSYFAIIFAFNPELSEVEIVKSSFNLGTRKWFLTFGLLFITAIIAMLGIIACGIGILFTMPLVYLPIYFIYRDAVGFDDFDELDQIGNN